MAEFASTHSGSLLRSRSLQDLMVAATPPPKQPNLAPVHEEDASWWNSVKSTLGALPLHIASLASHAQRRRWTALPLIFALLTLGMLGLVVSSALSAATTHVRQEAKPFKLAVPTHTASQQPSEPPAARRISGPAAPAKKGGRVNYWDLPVTEVHVAIAAPPAPCPKLPQPAPAAVQRSSSIPRIFHQSWRTATLPEQFAGLRQTWLAAHPQWEHLLWTNDDNRRLVAQHFPWFLATYDSLRLDIMRADAARYMYMYLYGGVYADLDVELLKPMDALLHHRAGAVVATMGTDASFVHSIPNAWMASMPRHPLWVMVLSHIMGRARNQTGLGAEVVTGPVMLKQTIEQWWGPAVVGDSDLTVLEPGLLFPFNWAQNSEEERRLCAAWPPSDTFDPAACKRLYGGKPYAITYWSHSWE